MIPIIFIYVFTLMLSTLATPTYFQDRTACATTAADPKDNLRNAYNTCNNQDEDGCPCTDLSMSEKQAVLDVHNQRREKVAAGEEDCYDPATSTNGGKKCPAAKNMNYLFWDNGLEQVAKYWAHQCIEEHQSQWPSPYSSTNKNTFPQQMYKAECDESTSNCRASGYDNTASSQYSSIGENLARKWFSTNEYDFDDILDGINNWYDESVIWNWNARDDVPVSGDPYLSSGKHFTQGVWDKTRLIGCSYAICDSNSVQNYTTYPTWLNVVCKYYPAGNFLGSQDPYEEATTNSQKCTNCDADRTSCVSAQQSTTNYNSLCGGSQCSSCGPDKGAISRCDYSPTTCPDGMLTSDGTGGTRYPTPNPTPSPTPEPTSQTPAPVVPSPSDCVQLNDGWSSLWNGIYKYSGTTMNSEKKYDKLSSGVTGGQYIAWSGSRWGAYAPGFWSGEFGYCSSSISSILNCDEGDWTSQQTGATDASATDITQPVSCPSTAQKNDELKISVPLQPQAQSSNNDTLNPLNMTEMHIILGVLIIVLITLCAMIFGFCYYVRRRMKTGEHNIQASENEMVYFENKSVDEHNTPTVEYVKENTQTQPTLKINVNGAATMVTKLPTTTPVTPLIDAGQNYE